MMRRGLWQKQRRPSDACLLCRYSYSYRRCIRPALRPSSCLSGGRAWDGLSRTTPPTYGRWARSYSVVAGSGSKYGLGDGADSRRRAGLRTAGSLGEENVSQRPYSTGGLPSWATQQVTPADSDGLLPHERAAKEQALGRIRPAAPGADAQSTGERGAAARPATNGASARPPNIRAPAWASAVPSWSSSGPSPANEASANPDAAKPSPQEELLKFLLPHERAARLRAAGRAQPPPASASAELGAGKPLLPHEQSTRQLLASLQNGRRRQPEAPGSTADHGKQNRTWSPNSPATPQQSQSSSRLTDREFLPSQSHERKSPLPEFKLYRGPVNSRRSQPADPGQLEGSSSVLPESSPPEQEDRRSVLPEFVLSRSPNRRSVLPEPDQPNTPADPRQRQATPPHQARKRRAPPVSPLPRPPDGISVLPEFTFPSSQENRSNKPILPELGLPGVEASGSVLPESSPAQSQDTRSVLPEFGPTQGENSGEGQATVKRYGIKPPRANYAFRPEPLGSSSAQPPTDELEWRKLTRRRRREVHGLDLSRPLDPQRPQPGPRFEGQRFPEWAKPERTSTSGEDAWKEMERAAADKKPATSADPRAWAWADQYIQEARQQLVKRGRRQPWQQQDEESADQEDVDQEPDAHTLPTHRANGDDRYGRIGRRERPKKPKPRPRRRDYDEEDDYDEEFYEERRRRKAEKAERERRRLAALEEAGPTPIFLPEFISVSNLAVALGQKLDIFLRQLEELGFEEVSKDHILTGETAALVAQEYGFEPKVDTGEDEDLKPRPPPDDPSSLPLRPPVVTIMGHVDHGKTTLLDYLRKSSIVSQEHGGITQHIGAFSVRLSSGKQITFLDTPGHAAFLSMRQRGANVTDMVVLVVAADDSVKPQTLEALKHARTAKVPIIVAINKIDKNEANVDRVKSDLAAHGVEIEDYGGDVQVVCVSGKTGQGMADLEENILLLAEMLDIRAEPDGMAEGWVLESTIKPIGRVATVLVKRGTLRPGDFVVAGRVHAKIRSLRDENGVEIDEAPPGTAVEILGWKEPPEAGDMVLQAPDESRAKRAVQYRQELKERGEAIEQMAQQEQDRREKDRERELQKAAESSQTRGRRGDRQAAAAAAVPDSPETTTTTTPASDESDEQSTTKYLNFTVKGDVHGSVEAVTAAILEQGNNEVRPRVLAGAPGMITESDVEHAAVSGSAIVNFNNAIPGHIKRLAAEAGVRILDHNVIYHLVEDVRDRLADALPPLVVRKVVGEAEVLQIFPINVRGRRYKNIAGCRVRNGAVSRNAKARVLRGGETVYEGIIETLKHGKKDVTEIKKGSECGMSFQDWDELQEGDHIQVLEEVQERRRL
ncbi:hypothetical protein VTK56DRAFT_2885 [Thermocarpiscus australiensis]